ncbi:MAG: Cof-type HAD-IIB family hydrolase [Pseudanabaenaceae cyanobacterium bins.68]|nr:Cof-type HAD-IIB family hydrolase [Pseudanabaenaceae cyanobacterium bins.68]
MGSLIKLLVLDIDGTISGAQNQVSPGVVAAVAAAQAQGVKVAIATGRMYCSALRFHQAVNSDCPLISYQGAFIKDPRTDQLVGHWAVEPNLALQLIQDFAAVAPLDLLSIHLYVNDCLYVQELTELSRVYAARSQVEAVPVGDLAAFIQTNGNDLPPTKLLALSDRLDLIEQLLNLKHIYPSDQLYLTRSQPLYFEATNPIANKGTAVKHLAENILGLTPEQVMAVGDNLNDLEMVEYAGIGVAMGNGAPGLQEVADWIAPDVEADGVAAAIAKFIL